MKIPSFFTWYAESRPPDPSPWLIVGKGPTFSEIGRYDLSAYNVMTLNDAVAHVPEATVAHFIDVESFARNLIDLRASSRTTIVMPWHPHVGFKPAQWGLLEFFANADMQDLLPRVVHYHASTAKNRVRPITEPVVDVKFFSAEAALSLLAIAGARTVRTIGVDGGTEYAKEFAGLTPLTNGRPSFDAQFLRMRKTAAAFGVDLAPIT